MRLTSKYISSVIFSALILAVGPGVVCAGDEQYSIGAEDVLDITVWQSPDLTKTIAVDARGEISYPFLGTIQVAGKSPKALEQILKEKLAQGYVKDPQVSVSVKEYNSKKILVFGEVVQPGMYKLKGNIPLLEMLFMVGGVKAEAKRMTIIRPAHEPENKSKTVSADSVVSTDPGNPGAGQLDGARAIEVNLIGLLAKGDLSQNVLIHPGDTIYVSSGTGERYYVLGRVQKPGPYEWVQDITVLEAIKQADGATEKAALNRILVRRNHGGTEDLIKLNVVDIMKGKKKDDVVVKAGDVIVVPESWI